MPRKYIRTSFYHVMCQGIKKEAIFDSSEKMSKYLDIIKKIKDEFAISIITYCVMSNHVHLLIHTNSIDELSRFMHKLNGSYGMYYNKRNERVGYVFRNRFRMEAINSDRYAFNCIQYIHNNPIKAGICKLPSEYYYSGYKEFVGKVEIIDSTIAQRILGERTYQQKEIESVYEKINYIDLDVDNDEICKEILKKFLDAGNMTLQNVLEDDIVLKKLLTELKIKNDLSYSCIERNLLINRKRISRLCPKKGQVC